MRRSFVIVTMVIAITFAVIRFFPLAWARPLAVPNQAADKLQFGGTIWDGYIADLARDMPPIQFDISPKKFVAGEPFVSFQSDAKGFALRGVAGRTQITDLFLNSDIAFIGKNDQRLAKIGGQVKVTLQELTLDKAFSKCVSAAGQVETNAMQNNRALWNWTGPILAGPISCEAGDIVAKVSGRDAKQTLSGDIRLKADGTYSADISVELQDRRIADQLPVYGFQKRGSAYVLTDNGRWR